MAKRRKTTKRRTSRRRSVGALKTSNLLVSIGGVLAGVAAAGYANKLLFDKVADEKKKTMYTSIMPIAAGIALPMFIKSELGKFAGAGMVAYGGGKFLSSMGLAGIGDADTMEFPVSISGDDNLSSLAGSSDPFAMAGDYAIAGDELSSLAGLGAFDDED
jgi:hypothetical protein